HLYRVDVPRAPRQFPDSLLEALDGLRRNPPLDHLASREAEAKKLSLHRTIHRALLPVHLQLELPLDEVGDRLHHAVARPFAAHVDVAVIRVAHERVAPSL